MSKQWSEADQRAAFGTVVGDIWRVDAHFSYLNAPVTYMTDGGKQSAYAKVADWLMSKNIQSIEVYRNGVLHQTIVVETEEKSE